MPVQEPEKKKTDIPVTDTEELKKQQSAVYENSFQKSGKLLPFLNAKAEYHMSRLDTVLGKIATQQDKIRKHENKIEQLGAKADRLEDRNNMLKAAFGNVPFVKNMIEANERRIDAIRNEKIPNRTQKLTNYESKINMLSAKRDRIEHKLSRVTALNDAIKSFSIGFNKERREVFSDAMSRLNGAAAYCLSDKRDNFISQKNALLAKYNDPKTFIGDKLNLQGKINDVNERISALENRITKLSRPETYYAEQTNDQLDASMKLTADKISEMTDSGNLSVPVLTYSEIKALCTGDERIKEKLMLDNEVKELKVLASEHQNTVYEMQDKIKAFPDKEAKLSTALDNLHTDREALRKLPIDPERKLPVFKITIDGTEYTDRKEAAKAFETAALAVKYADTPVKIGEFQGFPLSVTVHSQTMGGGMTAIMNGAYPHTAKLIESFAHNLNRIESALYNIDRRIDEVRTDLSRLKVDYAEAQKIASEPFPQQAELESKEERLKTLTDELNQAAIEAKKNAPKKEKTCYFERAKLKKEAMRISRQKPKKAKVKKNVREQPGIE